MALLKNINLITVSLQYSGRFMTFQINPESLHKSIPSGTKSAEVLGIGQVAVPATTGLAEITIESFFWQQFNVFPVTQYVNWIKTWQESKRPARLVTTMLPYSMQVVCESFEYESRAGEESDIYYTLKLKEYRDYGAKSIAVNAGKTLLQKLQSLSGASLPVLINPTTIGRTSFNKPVYSSPYTVQKGDSLQSITKKITGSTENWKELYNENKLTVGDNVELSVGIKLRIPDSWSD